MFFTAVYYDSVVYTWQIYRIDPSTQMHITQIDLSVTGTESNLNHLSFNVCETLTQDYLYQIILTVSLKTYDPITVFTSSIDTYLEYGQPTTTTTTTTTTTIKMPVVNFSFR